MFKLFRRFVVLVVILAVAAVALVAWMLDGLVKKGIEKGGTYALGIPVAAGSTSVSLLSGKVAIGDLRVDNPPGFSSDPFFAMKRVETEIPVKDLLGDKVEIPRLAFSGIRISLEQGLSQANWSVITDNLKRCQGGGQNQGQSGGGSKPEDAGSKRFIIRELVLDDVSVGVGVAALPIGGAGMKREIALPTIRLRDVGAEGGKGALICEVSSIVVQAVLGAVAAHGGGVLSPAMLTDLNGRLRGLGDGGIGGASIDQAMKDLSADPSKALQGIGNLLGGKKKQ